MNEDIAPGVKVAGGQVQHVQNDLDITCLPKDLPEFIEVDLGQLQAGHSLHVSGLKLPPGVESVALSKGDDLTVATIVMPRVAAIEEEEAAVVAAPSAADVPTTAQKVKEEEPAKEAGKGEKKK